jgi:GPN-loop GTPase
MHLIFITGTAGSGKSLLTASLLGWYREKGEDAITMNLDPGVLNLPYEPDVDVRTMIDYEGLMTSYSLGPNGALVLASDLLAGRLPEIQDEMDSSNPEFVIVDTPGQVELFAFRESGPYLAQELRADTKSSLFLMDSLVASSPTSFLSLLLLSTAVELRMGLPHIQVLSKVDLAKNAQ